MSMFYRGGVSAGQNFRWEISGSHGELVITSSTPANGNLQAIELELTARTEDGELTSVALAPGAEDDVLTRAVAELPAPAANVARLYRALAEDLRQGTTTVPGFAHALRQHRLIEAIGEANRTGLRQHLH
jgi:predicted dehydrogenase